MGDDGGGDEDSGARREFNDEAALPESKVATHLGVVLSGSEDGAHTKWKVIEVCAENMMSLGRS